MITTQNKVMKKKEKPFYKADELAKVLEVNVMTIYRYIKSGKLKAYKLGKEFRIERTEFERFLKMSLSK
jgi:excisionase family DNA binding protein